MSPLSPERGILESTFRLNLPLNYSVTQLLSYSVITMKRHFFKTLFILLLSVVTIPKATSQISEGLISNPQTSTNPSPNASAAQNIDVDMFHGACNVGIPLYGLKSRQLSASVKLSYATPSKKSSETYHPGWVGLGWTLSAGGSITRNIRGIPDEKAPNNVWPSDNAACDTAEDDFTFNFQGYSGRFFNHKGKWIIVSENDIVSLMPFIDRSTSKITGFLIQLPNGIRYIFGSGIGRGSDNAVEYSAGITGTVLYNPITWYLSEIQSPEGDVINFEYERGEMICSLSNNNHSIRAVYREYKTVGGIKTVNKEEIYNQTMSTDEQKGGSLITPSYLKRISGGPGIVSIVFDRSVTSEKNYPADRYPTNFPANKSLMKWYKLNTIRLIDESTGRCFKKYQMNYIDNSTNVLKLSSVREIGIYPDSAEISKPAYTFTYETQFIGTETLQKMTYPTGGFALFEYDGNTHSNPGGDSFEPKGHKITKIGYAGSPDEVPRETTYSYERYSQEDDCFITSGILNRSEYKSRSLKFSAFSGEVEWTKSASYDMPSPFPGMPAPDKVGYSVVSVTKNYGSRSGDTHTYTFSNYDDNFSWYRDEQRDFYPPVGKLLSVTNSSRKIVCEYMDLDPDKTVTLDFSEYLPFKYNSKTYSYKTANKSQTYYCGKIRPVKVKEYTSDYPGTGILLRTTSYTYDNETGNILTKEIVNIKEGDTYSTAYRYPYLTLADAVHDGMRRITVPYETICMKNGKIIAAEVTQFTDFSSNENRIVLPEKTFSLSTETPINESDYQYAAYRLNTLDPRHKPVAVYEYDSFGRLLTSRITGQEPTTYEWDNHDRLTAETVGDMETRYTYNVYGPESVTNADGSVTSTEYDALGQPTLVKDHAGNILQNMKYEYNINN